MATGKSVRPRRPRAWRWTRAHLERLPADGNRYEVLDGELLVTPQAGAWHQEVAVRLIVVLRPYCKAHALGSTLGPGAVVFGENELQPDVLVVPAEIQPAAKLTWTDLPQPSLVVEIISPGSERHDLLKKRDAYLRIGIAVYWVVDVTKRHVLVFRPGSDASVVVTDTLRWQPLPHAPALVIDVRALLED